MPCECDVGKELNVSMKSRFKLDICLLMTGCVFCVRGDARVVAVQTQRQLVALKVQQLQTRIHLHCLFAPRLKKGQHYGLAANAEPTLTRVVRPGSGRSNWPKQSGII
jgi:hypothetical protein